MFDSGPRYFMASPRLPREYNVSISYLDDTGKEKFQENMKMDLSIYENLTYRLEKDMDDLVKVLDDIKNIMRRKKFE